MDNQMMIISNDGEVFMDVTKDADNVRKADLFTLYEVWEKDGKVHKYMITDINDFRRAVSTKHAICVLVGSLKDKRTVITQSSWEGADKIMHEGFIYVKYSDLRFL